MPRPEPPSIDPTNGSEAGNKAVPPALLLRGAAVLLLVTGLALVVWLVDTALVHPWERVVGDLGFWLPFSATILVGVTALAVLFVRAARRLDRGDDLFGDRYHRRPESRPAEPAGDDRP